MKINLYNTKLTNSLKPMLVKEKEIQYDAIRVHDPKTVTDFFNSVLCLNKLAEEYCYLLTLNTKCLILGIFLVSKGTVRQSLVGIREIFLNSLLIGASNIIFCHNHPSTDFDPSRDDILLTKKLLEAGNLLEIPLIDHIIIGGNGYFSFKEQKML